jgi:hypothetical protein
LIFPSSSSSYHHDHRQQHHLLESEREREENIKKICKIKMRRKTQQNKQHV